ncbi:MAG: hypothetical protein PHN69_06690 [Candidatus Pacebacteria bacterium]|jgi:hypothetical protein|nr:hypothetical protein [Candidatus Paceibacterota bacterium]
MYKSVRLYILHKFGCDKCYKYTQQLVEMLNDAQFRVRLMEIDGDKTPDDIEKVEAIQFIAMYLQDGKFKYYLYDGYNMTIVNNIDSIVSSLQEATQFYADLYTKYNPITTALFKVKAFNEDKINTFAHRFYKTEPYEITYIVGFDPSVCDEDRKNLTNLMIEETGAYNENIDYQYNIETKTVKKGCNACSGDKDIIE